VAYETQIVEIATAFAAVQASRTQAALGQTQTATALVIVSSPAVVGDHPSVTPLPSVIPLPSVTPLPALPPPAPSPRPEDIEVDYRDQMELERSEIVRISLVYREALTPTQTSDIPASTRLVSTPIPFGTPGPLNAAFGGEYQAFIVSCLEGTDAFDVKPEAEKEYPLMGQERIDWQWAVAPKHEGSQVLSLMVEVRYKKDSGQQIKYPIYRKRLPINVSVQPFMFGGPIRLYDSISNSLAFIAGGILAWVGQRIAQRMANRKPAKPRR